MTTIEDVARLAFIAYGSATGGKNYQDLPIPTWENLGTTIQNAWIAAASAAYQQGYLDREQGCDSLVLL